MNRKVALIPVGTVIASKYRVLRLLGDGGMGAVYEARHERLGTSVALKVMHPELARRPGISERFLQEARVSAQIRSPHVVQVLDVDQTPDGVAYLVMELLVGEPLGRLLDRVRTVPAAEAVDYSCQILAALEAAHAVGVVHRDLKPENVFITNVGGRRVLKLIDFGIAKVRQVDVGARNLTLAGVAMGTVEYMAPEQAFSADKADARSDLYALGVMLYELLAGVRPVRGDDARTVATRVERGELVPLLAVAPGTPPELAALCHRAMSPRPELRFQSATEMRLALESLALVARPGGTPTSAAIGAQAVGLVQATSPGPAPIAFSPAPPPAAPYGAAGSSEGPAIPLPPRREHRRTRGAGTRTLLIGGPLLLLIGGGAILYASLQGGSPGAEAPSVPVAIDAAPSAPTVTPPLDDDPVKPLHSLQPTITPTATQHAPVAARDAGGADAAVSPANPGIVPPTFPFPQGFPMPNFGADGGFPVFPLPSSFQLPTALPGLAPPPAH
jgi:serine/threonine-protein kinase